MIVEEAINKLIRDSINLITGVAGYAIRGRQNSPIPTGAFASVYFMNMAKQGNEDSTYVNLPGVDLTQTISGLRQLFFSVNFYRNNAYDNANKVMTGFKRDSIIELFRAANVGFSRVSQIRDLSDNASDGWEERAQFDLYVNAVGKDEDIITSIESMNIELEYQANNLIFQSTIEVDNS